MCVCVEYTPLVLLKQYEGVLSQVSKKEKKGGNFFGEWLSDFESGHQTHPANRIPRNRQGRRRREDNEG